ncbi:MAG: ribosome assembly factor SBDS [archaeon]|jgi:ribosome maturation protein SDO1|nr:ribosome assembly factor SBDS [archaeon]
MPNVIARTKVKGKQYEIEVDIDEALKVKNGKGDITKALNFNRIFTDVKKGNGAKEAELKDAFGTSDVYEIAKKIIMSGEIQKTQDVRDSERDAKIKRVVDLILKNAVDQHGRPYTEERIKRAINEAHYSFDSRLPEQQLPDIISKLQTVIPIKLETKRIKLVIPAQFTGQVYGILKDYKESEDWLSNGALSVVLSMPAGMLMDFYEKLNHITHGAVQSEEIVEKK